MNRTMVSGIAAFALLIGAGHAMNATTAEAGLFSKWRAKRACGGHSHCGAGHSVDPCCAPVADPCCEPAPEPCCAPAPAPEPCCAPAPAPEPCCAPAPEPCCAPEPAACCEPAPCGKKRCGLFGRRGGHGCGAADACCETAVVEAAPCCGSTVVETGTVMATGAGCTDCGGAVVSSEGYDLAPGETLVPGSVTTGSSEAAPAAPQSSSDEGGEDAEVPPPAPEADASTDA